MHDNKINTSVVLLTYNSLVSFTCLIIGWNGQQNLTTDTSDCDFFVTQALNNDHWGRHSI